jgi:hypothetical protein
MATSDSTPIYTSLTDVTASSAAAASWRSSAELQYPVPHRFIRDVEAALGQELLDVAVALGEPDVQPYCVLDHLEREAMPAIG